MRKATITALFLILKIHGFTQDVSNRFLTGASISIIHDDAGNNTVPPIYTSLDARNTYKLAGEFGYFLSPNSIIGLEAEGTIMREKAGITQNITSLNNYGISINPKYKFIKKISTELWLYMDFKAIFQYAAHENIISQLDLVSYEYISLKNLGREYSYGIAVNPGFIINVYRNIGIKIDYSFVSVIHSSIKEAENNEVPFDDKNAWDYAMNMNVSGLNLGIIYTR